MTRLKLVTMGLIALGMTCAANASPPPELEKIPPQNNEPAFSPGFESFGPERSQTNSNILREKILNYTPKRGFSTRVEAAKFFRDRQKRVGPFFEVDPVTSGTAVTGTAEIPVFMFHYSNDQGQRYGHQEFQRALYGAAPQKTVTTHYEEMSGGIFSLGGTVYRSVGLSRNSSYYEGPPGCNGLCFNGHLGEAMRDTIRALDVSVDFRRYDNDGPDGIPDSGDDDGYVDFPAFVHSRAGGECGTDGIWSHKFSMAAMLNQADGYETSDTGKSGRPIKVDDYVIMPALSCDGRKRNDIGVFSHEFGHAFTLPDLYDTVGDSSGIGGWGLMGSGSWGGLGGGRSDMPTHMTAWSKDFLGWLNPTVITEDTMDITLPGPKVNSAVFVDYSDNQDTFDEEYLLLEYRSKKGFDETLADEGLVIYEINNTRILQGLASNQVNAEQFDQGVDVIEADGRMDLHYGRNRADKDDVFSRQSNITKLENGFAENIGASICNIRYADASVTFDVYVSRTTCPTTAPPPPPPHCPQTCPNVCGYDNNTPTQQCQYGNPNTQPNQPETKRNGLQHYFFERLAPPRN